MSPFKRRTLVPLLAASSLLVPIAASAALSEPVEEVSPVAQTAVVISPVPRIHAHVLRLGSKGQDVSHLQELLNRVGVTAAVSGRYRYATARAVQRFQLAAVLETSGVAGPKTIARLRATASGTAQRQQQSGGGVGFGAAGVRAERLGDRMPLTRGMSGRDVRQLQDFLRRVGVKSVPKPTGEFDGRTAAAVKRFEAKTARAVDGTVDAGDVYRLVRTVGDAARPGDLGDPQGVELAALPLGPGDVATLDDSGLAVAPEGAPQAVRQIIAAGNKIATKPYIYGGGHGSWTAAGYDCSGSVSFALRGANLLQQPLASYDFFDWGKSGPGQWVTIYTNSGHMFMTVAGLRFDTSGRSGGGSRWQRDSRAMSGYQIRHPAGL